ncbi:MAG: TOBE domain-containing protein [Firmicutes bacterium]|nr:TOBE domain-containing protein [Bacillota bacterium]
MAIIITWSDSHGIVSGLIYNNSISSTISMTSIKELGLEVGKPAYAVIKATSVMVAVD